MIETLSIRNIALIDELDLELAPGLNIFTGETGAGKSVILRSIGLVLGERVSADIVREGADFAKVEAVVAPPEQHSMWHTDFAFRDALDPSDAVILSRRIRASGRSRCHINGQLVNLSQLQTVGTLLVDIHGQHEHQSLFRTQTHLKLLDDFGGCEGHRQQVSKIHAHLQTLQREAADLSATLRASEREKDLLEFEIKELTAANLEDGEDEELAAEARILSNSEALANAASRLYALLEGGTSNSSNTSVLERLKDAAKTLTKLSMLDNSLSEIQERLETSLYELEDVALHVRHYRDTVEYNPMRLDEVTDRLALIAKLKRRYGKTIAEILAYHAEADQKLRTLHLGSEKQEALQVEIDKTIQEAQHKCRSLSVKRQHVAKQLSKQIEKELRTLGMDKAEFHASVQPIADERGPFQIDGERYAFRSHGMDAVEFLIAPNVGSEARPISKIASGGEISRMMLALKTVLVQSDEIPTLLFDEIDSGIGGKVADVVGRKLKELSEFAQVICITHLPQIARFADRHFRVEKKVVINSMNACGHSEPTAEYAHDIPWESGETIRELCESSESVASAAKKHPSKNPLQLSTFRGEERTLITAKPLTPEEQIKEITRMYGGEETEIGLAHAREVLLEK